MDNFARGVSCQRVDSFGEKEQKLPPNNVDQWNLVVPMSLGLYSLYAHDGPTLTQASAKEVFLQAQRTQRLLMKHGDLS